jgi:uncharacterized membrane protein YoaK (UPF0700 family)
MKTTKWLIGILCAQILLLCIILALAAGGNEKTPEIVAWIVIALGAVEAGMIFNLVRKEKDE